jgi:hypothetical protein
MSYYQEGHNGTIHENVEVLNLPNLSIRLFSLVHQTYPTRSDISIGFQSLCTGSRSDISDGSDMSRSPSGSRGLVARSSWTYLTAQTCLIPDQVLELLSVRSSWTYLTPHTCLAPGHV